MLHILRLMSGVFLKKAWALLVKPIKIYFIILIESLKFMKEQRNRIKGGLDLDIDLLFYSFHSMKYK